jgi:putative DNA primase/helicase
MYDDVIRRFGGLSQQRWGWKARCPAHDDRRASLSIRISDQDDLLIKCHAGCSFEDVLRAAGVCKSECYPQRNASMKEVASYGYKDEDGKLLFEVVRFEPKDFRQRQPDGTWGLNGARRVLYRLPELIKSEPRTVFVAEGERDVDRLYSEGLIGTCNPMGAGKWSADYNASLKGRTVAVIPDNDKPGRDHAEQIALSLRGIAQKVAVLNLPSQYKDVSDWFNAGGKREELIALCKKALESDVRGLIEQARRMDRHARWLAVRQLISDLEADET